MSICSAAKDCTADCPHKVEHDTTDECFAVMKDDLCSVSCCNVVMVAEPTCKGDSCNGCYSQEYCEQE